MHITGRSTFRAVILAVLTIGIVGCADLDTVRNAPLDRGVARDFDVPYNHLTAATLTALSSVNVNLVSSSEDTTGTIYIIDKSMTFTSWGEVGRIYVKKTPAPPTTMIVYWEKRARGGEGIGADEFTRVFFDAVAKQL
jgi:hypothetical protein